MNQFQKLKATNYLIINFITMIYLIIIFTTNKSITPHYINIEDSEKLICRNIKPNEFEISDNSPFQIE